MYDAKPHTIAEVKAAVCQHFDITMNDLEGPRRARFVSYPRQLAFYLCREKTKRSFPQIAHHFGDRDHTTVMYGCDQIDGRLKQEKTVKDDCESIASILRLNNPSCAKVTTIPASLLHVEPQESGLDA